MTGYLNSTLVGVLLLALPLPLPSEDLAARDRGIEEAFWRRASVSVVAEPRHESVPVVTAVPAPPPAEPPSSPPPSGVEGWRGLVAAHFPADAVDTMLRIMACESRGDPGARNPSGATGLFQIMPFWADHYGVSVQALHDPDTNVRVAKGVWDQQGYAAWAACH